MSPVRLSALLVSLVCLVSADVYMHSPRGSNDRNCEKNVNRNNGNRLFDSQNNAKGGYACGRSRNQGPTSPTQTMKLYSGSKTTIEWTNQHGCGSNPKVSCEVVLQYACEDTLDPSLKLRSTDSKWVGAPRDGTPETADTDDATDTIPEETAEVDQYATDVKKRRYGVHESYDFYKKCKQRMRNKGLFTADRDMNRNDARATRQNPNGNRRGLECPEERDYYPYWAPNPWRDIAVITSNPQRCPYYKAESTALRGECQTPKEFYGTSSKAVYESKCPGFTAGDTKTTTKRREEGLWFGDAGSCKARGNKWADVRYALDHPDTTALNTAQKAAETKGDGVRMEIFKLPRSATCSSESFKAIEAGKKTPVALTADNWGFKTESESPTFADAKATLKKKRASFIYSKQKYQRPLMAEFTVQTSQPEKQNWWKTEIEVGVFGKVNKMDKPDKMNLDWTPGYSVTLGKHQAYTAVTRPAAENWRWRPSIVGEQKYDFYKAAVTVKIEVLENGWIKTWVDGELVSEWEDSYQNWDLSTYHGNLFVYASGNDDVVVSAVNVIENYGNDAASCATKLDQMVLGEASTQAMHTFSSVATGAVTSCASEDGAVGNYVKLSGYFKPTETGQFRFSLNKVPGAKLYMKTKGSGSWADATALVNVKSRNGNIYGLQQAFYEDSESDAAEWKESAVITKQLDGTLMHGPWGNEPGKPESVGSISRSLTGLPAHSHIRVLARFWALGSWDREVASMEIDGSSIWSRSRALYYDQETKTYTSGCGAHPSVEFEGPKAGEAWAKYPHMLRGTSNFRHDSNYYYEVPLVPDSEPAAAVTDAESYNSCFYDIDMIIPHTAAAVAIKFATTMNQPLRDEGWAISGLKVFTSTSANNLDKGSWVTSAKIDLSAGTSYQFAAIAPAGATSKPLRIGVGKQNAAATPLDASPGGSADYQVCATSNCGDEQMKCQPKAAANCECEDWATARPDLGFISGAACCGNPSVARKRTPFCYCKSSSTSRKATFTSWKSEDWQEWSNGYVWKDMVHGPYDRNPGLIARTYTGMKSHEVVQLKFKLFAIDNWDNEIFKVFIDGKEQVVAWNSEQQWGVDDLRKRPQPLYKLQTKNDVNGGSCDMDKNSGFAKYPQASQFPNNMTSKDRKHVVCYKEIVVEALHTAPSMRLEITSSSRSEVGDRSWAVGPVEVLTSREPETVILEDLLTDKKTKKQWAYCLPSLSASKGKITSLSEQIVEDESEWAEQAAVEPEVAAIEAVEAMREQVDCVDGKSSTSRENQLGNARGTANPDAKIPHGLNANRYVWTVPSHVNKNCVLRLRYNISTSDYWPWNNKGTPMTDSSVSNLGRRRRNDEHSGNKSPIMQDPYIGIGDDKEVTFLNLAVNTNQYGRTFQDRSHVFEIAERDKGVPATAEIINVNVRGKRGNIVQTYPAVEYDFVPNDLCLEVGDYVHFQWTGSDYNPARNPNDGAGSGDVGPGAVNQASRADRSNLVELDTTPRGEVGAAGPTDPAKGYPRSKAQTGAGKHHAEEALGMSYPAGYLSDFANLDTKYTGMFWKDGKPDKATIMKLAFINQVEILKAKGNKKCKTLPELNAITNQNERERDPENCSLLNAASTPYFDGGLVKMEKAGRFPFYSTRNNNFSNRNHAGIFCVSDGANGQCSAGKTCEDMIEADLVAKQRRENDDGSQKLIDTTAAIDMSDL